ncbi:MAG TPA: hypothetical protein VI894_01115 [Candidatus Nanoarchaeia archaeon]|nr:hypothetical protein [Candidatus Nanoarchaeia archaeon]
MIGKANKLNKFKKLKSKKAVFFTLSFFLMISVIYSLASLITSKNPSHDEPVAIERAHALYSSIEQSFLRVFEGTTGINITVYDYANVSVVFQSSLPQYNTNLKNSTDRLKRFIEYADSRVNITLPANATQNLTLTIQPYNVSITFNRNAGTSSNFSVAPYSNAVMRNITSYDITIFTGQVGGNIQWVTVNTGNFPFRVNITKTASSDSDSRNIDPEKPLEVRITGLGGGSVFIYMRNYTRLEIESQANSPITFTTNITFARISSEDVFVAYPALVNITSSIFNYSQIYDVKIKT